MNEQVLRGKAFIDGRFRDDAVIRIEGGSIAEVEIDAGGARRSGREDECIVPGFIDMHVHGADGGDFMDGTVEAVERVAAFHARHGTTTLAATTLSGSRGDITNAIRAIAEAAPALSPHAAEIVAIHLEGPYLNGAKAGAQDPSSLRAGSMHELEEWMLAAPGLRWIMTVAPEVDGVKGLITRFHDKVLFSIGHTMADFAGAIEAVGNGARHFTHLFNAMPPLHHRHPGAAAAALISDDVTAEVVADGIHLHPVLLGLCHRLMPRRLVLVTDAIRACGMPDGNYRLHHHDVEVEGGVARLADGTIAGSTLTMARAVQNMVELAGIPLEEVIPMATEVPARALGIEKTKGKIEIGYDADLVVLSSRLEPSKVLIRGHEISLA